MTASNIQMSKTVQKKLIHNPKNQSKIRINQLSFYLSNENSKPV